MVNETNSIQTEKNLFLKKTKEDVFYEKIGIKYHDTHMFGVASRLKGRLVVVSVMVALFIIYKKSK